MKNINDFVTERLHLSLNENKGKVMPVSNGMDFLGYVIRQDYMLVRRRVVNNLKSKLDWFEKRLVSEKDGMKVVIHSDINSVMVIPHPHLTLPLKGREDSHLTRSSLSLRERVGVRVGKNV